MTPEQVKEARDIMHKLDRVNGQLSQIDDVMSVGDCSIDIALDSGRKARFSLTSCDVQFSGKSLVDAMRDILNNEKDRYLKALRRLGVEI